MMWLLIDIITAVKLLLGADFPHWPAHWWQGSALQNWGFPCPCLTSILLPQGTWQGRWMEHFPTPFCLPSQYLVSPNGFTLQKPSIETSEILWLPRISKIRVQWTLKKIKTTGIISIVWMSFNPQCISDLSANMGRHICREILLICPQRHFVDL